MMPVLRFRPSGAWPAIVVAASSGAWGLYWLPLRALNEAGIPAAWVPALLYVVPFALLALVALAGRRSGFTLRSAFTGMLAGSALALYSDSLLFTEVVRALIFFYLTPVWSTILERILLGNRISAVRLASILLGFSGMGIAVGAGSENFLSGFNAGDAMALASGFAWAWASIRIYSGREGGALVLSTWFLFRFRRVDRSPSRLVRIGRKRDGRIERGPGRRVAAVYSRVWPPGRHSVGDRHHVGCENPGARPGRNPHDDRGLGGSDFSRALGRGADRHAGGGRDSPDHPCGRSGDRPQPHRAPFPARLSEGGIRRSRGSGGSVPRRRPGHALGNPGRNRTRAAGIGSLFSRLVSEIGTAGALPRSAIGGRCRYRRCGASALARLGEGGARDAEAVLLTRMEGSTGHPGPADLRGPLPDTGHAGCRAVQLPAMRGMQAG